jgi:two-component system cell cycle sensor histidine kinase/response regulator CckA
VELTEATQDRNVRLAAGTYACVEISDNGPGIDAGGAAAHFRAVFHDQTSAASRPGAGAGLWHHHQPRRRRGDFQPAGHGHVGADLSAGGKGLSRGQRVAARKMHGTETILVVDDESLVLTMAETILTDFGYKVLTASNGQKALAILSQRGQRRWIWSSRTW